MEAAPTLTHLRRGTLEYCVLALLRGGERYAGDVVAELGKDGELVTSEGTVYPLLSRLRRDGLVDSVLRDSPSGPARRYYRLTGRGEAAVRAFATRWAPFRDAVDRVLSEGGF